ncbi:MAG: bifunctional diguanylate cyclase/phosphodiesterase [Proteobacteria bacterium]|nr:bifunctional diguanylate cyclase/phosphodiesterase [Pseudomonadota bacterium]
MDKNNSSNIIDLSRSLQQKETEIELLQQTFTEVGSELDLEKIFQIVSERALELIDAETLLIPLLDKNCVTYTYRGGAGKNISEIVGESLPIELGVCGWVWKHKKPWWHGMLDELSEEEKNRWEQEIGNMILVPLQGKRHFLGGISGINKNDGTSFTKKDLNLLQLFASIVSIAIENAMAVKDMEDSHELNENYRYKLENLNKQLIESSKELEYLSLYDSVTALPNRSLFYDRLSRDIIEAENNNSTIGVLLIDIDSFKDINDTLGHDHGDSLLNKIAHRFGEEIKNNETLARLGGDEFIVVLPDQDQRQVIKRAESFINCLKDSFTVDQNSIVVSASVGVAVYPEHGNSISNLLSHADFAMYEAKNSSIKICVYDPENDHLAQGHLAMVADVRKALDEKQFELHYQPKISAESGQIVSAEALGRWYCKDRGNVPPNIFIRVLEQNGLIDEYTYWAIETALAQAKVWKSGYSIMRVAVNVSPQTLMHPEFKENIDRIIKDESDGDLLTFEITENLFLSEFDRLAEVLEHICSLGVELSIDDYGTGYSSLSRLRRLPVSELKIDQTFIKDMVENKDDEAVVHSTIELAHNLGLTVVAEGVENTSALNLLTKLGCDTIQGFLISRPLPVEKFNRFVEEK